MIMYLCEIGVGKEEEKKEESPSYTYDYERSCYLNFNEE